MMTTDDGATIIFFTNYYILIIVGKDDIFHAGVELSFLLYWIFFLWVNRWNFLEFVVEAYSYVTANDNLSFDILLKLSELSTNKLLPWINNWAPHLCRMDYISIFVHLDFLKNFLVGTVFLKLMVEIIRCVFGENDYTGMTTVGETEDEETSNMNTDEDSPFSQAVLRQRRW